MEWLKANWKKALLLGAAGYLSSYGVPPETTSSFLSAIMSAVGLG